MIITAGKTNKSVYFYIVGDASHASPGDPITGLLFSNIETGGSASYMRQGAARVDFTLVTLASASAAHTDGGFILVDDTNMPGLYRCDVPDAAFATGVDQVVIDLVVASANNAAVAPVLVDITDIDLRDSVRAGMTALPNAAADGAGGLPISDAGALDLDTILGRITANVALASVCTEARLVELAAANLPADIDAILTDTADMQPRVVAIEIDTSTTLQAELDAIQAAVITNAAGADIAADIIALKAETVLIVADTNELQTDWVNGGRLDLILDIIAADTTTDIPALIAALNDISEASVLTQVNAALDTAISELGVAAPAATPTLRTGLMLLYMALRNQTIVQTSGTDALEVHNDADTLITKKVLTDDGSDLTLAKMS